MQAASSFGWLSLPLVWRSKPTGRNGILWKGRRKALFRAILGFVVNVVFRRLMFMRN